MITFHRRFLVILYLCIVYTHIHAHLTLQQLPSTFHTDLSHYKDPILVTAIGGLGAKLSLAQQMHQHAVIGFDLVAHCINELIAHNAKPLFFSTYFATHTVSHQEMMQLSKGITQGCLESNCILSGSHTTDIHTLLQDNHYDIGGFAVGVAEHTDAQQIPMSPGDIIIGLPTPGIHATSFPKIQSLIDRYNMDITDKAPFATPSASLAEALLIPNILYTDAVMACKPYIKAIAHVAHGGLYTTTTQLLPSHLGAQLELYHWSIPPLQRWIKQIGAINTTEMTQTFNLGIGMIFIVHPHDANKILNELHHKKIPAVRIGILEPRSEQNSPVTIIGTIGTSRSRILLIGNGAQEHALAWKLAQSPHIERVFVVPGNGGTAAEKKVINLPINPAHYGALITYAQQNMVDMVIVGTQELCTQGMSDAFYKAGIACIGPSKKAAQLMLTSYAHDFMKRHGIASWTHQEGLSICFAVLSDGNTFVPFTSCQQYKKQYNNDTGSDTQGMGACCPAPCITQKLHNRIMHDIIEPTINGLKAEGALWSGFLAVDLIITPQGDPSVVSYRFNLGNCETSAMIMRLRTDLCTLCYALCHKALKKISVAWDTCPSCTIALTDTTAHPKIIVGVSDDFSPHEKVFHMHTTYKDGKYSTNGIQPLYVTAMGQTLEKARNNTYKLVQQIYWPGIAYRNDIGYREISQ